MASDDKDYRRRPYDPETLGYRTIAEAVSGPAWSLPQKRQWTTGLSASERDNARNTVIPNAKRWVREGAPAKVYLSDDGKRVWDYMARLCGELLKAL